MSNTLLNFYRGCHGMGIVISVSYGKDRVIFDFGAPFEPASNIFDGVVKPRIQNKVYDALLLNKIPMIDGIFSKDDIKDINIEAYEDTDYNSAIFICHLHLDHMSEIDKVAKQVPVYIHQDGLKLFNSLNFIENNIQTRTYSSFEYHKEIKIGCISLTPYYSDHPCPGSASFLIKTPDATILYSGDIRFHGTNSQKAYEELELFNNEKIDLLIVDSTTTSPSEFKKDEAYEKLYNTPSKDLLPGSISEQDIYNNIYDHLKDFDGLGVFNQYIRDIKMMKHMYELAKSLNRTLVMEPSYAYILNKLSDIKVPIYIPDTGNDYSYAKDFEVIDINTIKNNPNKYLLQNTYSNILTLIDFDGIKGKYFHLFGEPLVVQDKHYQIMLNIIEKLNWTFNSYANLYSFSHTYPNQLAYYIQKINAKSVVAVHSKHPENLNPVNSEQFFPEENKFYKLIDGKLKVV